MPWTAACQASQSITNSWSLAPTHVHRVSDAHPTISSSVVPFSCHQSLPASGSFPMSQFFTSGGQSIGASASASVLPMNIQDWFPSGLTGLISLLSKGLSRVFNTRGFSQPRDSTQVSCIAGRFFTIWVTREAHSEAQTHRKAELWSQAYTRLPQHLTTSPKAYLH